MFHISSYRWSDFSELVRLVRALFSENNAWYDLDELTEELHEEVSKNQMWIFFAEYDYKKVWCIVMWLRYEYVEWAETSPVWYIEEIYVEPWFRLKWVGKLLFEEWKKRAQDQWCTELWSDTRLKNEDAQQFHEHLWFEEEERVVHYLMKL